ncbi:chemotaxis protein [Escherichia fergusonii]|nr:chemotaxis protein [Escherichia fergusonii]
MALFSRPPERLAAHLVTNGAIVIHTQRLKSDPGGNLLS